MNYIKNILLTTLAIVAIFIVTTYAACTADKCAGLQCLNGGICYSGECACVPGYTGARCDIKVDTNPCTKLECQNGGTCVDGTCKCPSGYYGLLCEQKVDSCNYIKCENGGVCVDGSCDCSFGYTGNRCQVLLKQQYLNKSYVGDGYDDKGNKYKNWIVRFAYSSQDVSSMMFVLYNNNNGIVVNVPCRLVNEHQYVIDEYDTSTPVTTYEGNGAVSTSEISFTMDITDVGGTTKLTFEKMLKI